MDTIVVYSPEKSSRLRYVLDWLFKERLKLNYSITHNEEVAIKNSCFISYGKKFEHALSIPDLGLLWDKGTKPHAITTGMWQGLPVLYYQEGHTLPFDLFSAIFFLLSRYEEYYPFTPDKHGRYPAAESVLYKNGCLKRPLLDEWVWKFRALLQEKINFPLMPVLYSFQPTYDIDIAWSYKHKGSFRIAGAYLRDAIKGNAAQMRERTRVLLHKESDPYDSFDWMRNLHIKYYGKPIYFILSGMKTTTYDKNVPPWRPQMRLLVKRLAHEGIIGIHPSYYSGNGPLLHREKKLLETISGKNIFISRQHYIRLSLPATYQRLIKNSITDDYSMGYGSHLGFRAGTGNSFLWYDFEQESISNLRVHPFCFMETTAVFEEHLSIPEAFQTLSDMKEKLRLTHSKLITVFHNFSLGTAKEWAGCRELYTEFFKKAS